MLRSVRRLRWLWTRCGGHSFWSRTAWNLRVALLLASLALAAAQLRIAIDLESPFGQFKLAPEGLTIFAVLGRAPWLAWGAAVTEPEPAQGGWLPEFHSYVPPPLMFAVRLPVWTIVSLAVLLVASRVAWVLFKPRHGECLRCGYNLTGNVSGRCPECGCRTGINWASAWKRGAAR